MARPFDGSPNLRLPSVSAAKLVPALLVAFSFIIAGCGANPAETSARESPTTDKPCVTNEATNAALSEQYDSPPDQYLDAEEALVKDSRWYAEDQGISLEEAVRRMKLQQDPTLQKLRTRLEAGERGTFAGLWIQHEPEYRFVALFTEAGEEKIIPYIECSPHADVVEVRNGADATLAELLRQQEEAGRIIDDLGIPTDSATNVMKNRVEVRVADRARLEAALHEADKQLPEHVVVQEGSLAEPAVPGYIQR